MSSPNIQEECVLVLAPTGRDATITREVLAREGFVSEACRDVRDLCEKVAAGAGAIVLAEEALTAGAAAALAAALARQPPWSDIPILVLTTPGETTESRVRAIRALEPSGNVTILERPARIFTLAITVQAMLRARRRQYQMRDLYTQVHGQMERLQAERDLRARFVSLLAHDLRGPLSTATMSAALIERRLEQLGERRDVTVRIKRSLERIELMVRDLLDTSRIQAGHLLTLRLAEGELGEIVWEVVDELNALHDGRVRFQIGQRIEGVWGADELRRAVWNLVANALKYGDATAPVTVTVARAGLRASISVHNRGNPISAEDRARIFEPFARAATSETRSQLGWGLGLTLVRGCAAAHGGQVHVVSSEAEGTTFVLELPLDARPYQSSPDIEATPLVVDESTPTSA
jgi:signal transduction histidine kinase